MRRECEREKGNGASKRHSPTVLPAHLSRRRRRLAKKVKSYRTDGRGRRRRKKPAAGCLPACPGPVLFCWQQPGREGQAWLDCTGSPICDQQVIMGQKYSCGRLIAQLICAPRPARDRFMTYACRCLTITIIQGLLLLADSSTGAFFGPVWLPLPQSDLVTPPPRGPFGRPSNLKEQKSRQQGETW